MKKVVWLCASITLVAAAAYSVTSLNRWEWTRALYFGLVALFAEVGLATAVVVRKIDHAGPNGEGDAGRERDEVRDVLRSTRPRRRRFAWLEPEEVVSRSNVFITMLVGGGVLLSGLAWVLDKVAARTTSSLEEGRLAGDLTSIAYPEGGLQVDEVSALAQSVPHFDDPGLRILLGRREP